MLSRNKICFHPVECCCSHFPGEGWILAQCERVSHIMGKCLGFLNVLLDIQGFVGNPYQPPALFAPAWTAQLSWRRGKKLLPSSCAALLLDGLCAWPPASSTGCGWAEICPFSNSLWEEKRWKLVKIIGKCKVSWIFGILVYTSQQQAMESD